MKAYIPGRVNEHVVKVDYEGVGAVVRLGERGREKGVPSGLVEVL